MATRTVHFVLYLPDQGFAIYRRTAAGSRAPLVVTNVPADVSDRAVEIAANLTAIAVPSGMPAIVDFAQLGKGRTVNLYHG
jgi:hypothetical protein